jgi:hypothetical protein
VDAFDIFSEQKETYRVSLWLYNSTKGVSCPGGHWDTIDEAETALAAYAEEDLVFHRDTIEVVAAFREVHSQNINVAVVLRVEMGDVVSRAPVPDGWFPPGDPRR